VRIGNKGTEACNVITGTGSEDARVCVKISETEDRRFEDCDDKNVCASSYACKQVTLCTMDPAAIADHATSHFLVWIKAQESDDVIAPKLKAAEDALATARDNGDPKALDRAEKDVDKYRAKDDTRTLMTEQWLSAQQFDKAIGYWKGLLDERPKDTGIMGNLAGIANKAGDWRGSIDWYNRVAGASSDDDSKVAAYQAVGYVAFAKLKSNTLTQAESIEAADRGMAALQKGAALAPKNGRLWGLQGSLFLYRSQAEGASFAWLIDRASGQDLQRVANVLAKEAKKAQEGGASTTPPATTPTQPASPAPKAGG
jgi:tetratricopeptide (TPR) repeat protein